MWSLLWNAYLIAENANWTRGGDLIGAKPDGRQPRWNAEDENLGAGHDGLSNESHVKQVSSNGKDFDPSSKTSPECPDHTSYPQPLKEKKQK